MTARDDARVAVPGRPAACRVAITAGTLVLLALALAAPARAEWDPIPPEAWQEPARPDSGGGDAILLLDRSECHDLQGRFRFEYFGRARVFTAEGRDLGTIDIPYLKGRWKLSDVRARSVLPNGRASEFDPAQIVETTAFRYGDYHLVHATIAVPGVEQGCIVEWAYTLEGEAPQYGGWRFTFANRVYTCLSSHTWRSSSWWKDELPRSWRYTGIPSVLVEEICEPNREHPLTVTFTVRHQRGVRGEELAPPAEDATPRVTVFYGGQQTTGYWSSWKSRFDEYQKELNKKPGALEAIVKEIRARHPDPEAALAEVYSWVQGRLRSLDEPPWDHRPQQEHEAKSYHWVESLGELLDRGEAMPLEINCLMVAAARQLGLAASLGFVGDRRFEVFDPRSRGLPPLNVITCVKLANGAIGLQPNSRFAPFASLPWYLRGGPCLLSGETPDLLWPVPANLGAPAKADWKVEVQLDAEGVIDGRVEARLSGEEAAQWKRDLWEQEPARWSAFLTDRLAENGGPQATCEAPALDSSPDSEFVLRATARWPNIASVTGDRIMVPLDRLIPWRTHASFRPESRKQPVLFRYPRDEVFHAGLRLPPGMTVDRVPDPQTFENGAGSWSVQWTKTGDVVSVERRLVMRFAEYPAQDYRVVRTLFRALEQADQSVLLVTKQP